MSDEEHKKNHEEMKIFATTDQANDYINLVRGRMADPEIKNKFWDNVSNVGVIYTVRYDNTPGGTIEISAPGDAVTWFFKYASPIVHFCENLAYGEVVNDDFDVSEFLSKLEGKYPTDENSARNYSYTLSANQYGFEKIQLDRNSAKLQYNKAVSEYKNDLGAPWDGMTNAEFEYHMELGDI